MIDLEGGSVKEERVSGLALTEDQESARSYDVRVSEEIAELLRDKPEFDDDTDVTSEQLYPVAGVVEGVKKDAHIVANNAVGPKATTEKNEIIPFPQEKIKLIGRAMANKIITGNKTLFGIEEDGDIDDSEYTLEEVASLLDNQMVELVSFYDDDLDKWGYGIEGWPTDVPLPEEQMRGVERRREFMLAVAKECIKELMSNETFRELIEEKDASFKFCHHIDYSNQITVWLVTSRGGDARKSVVTISDQTNDEIVLELDDEVNEDQAATPA